MSSEKSTAIILRVIEFSETSCIVTMLTREFGKLTAIAKGARRPKSPFDAALDVLAICRIVFLHKSSRAMDVLTEAKLERRFRNAAGHLEWLYAGYYVVELLRTMVEEGDPHPDLFDLAVNTIAEIDQRDSKFASDTGSPAAKKYYELNLCVLRFEVGLLKILGHMPMLTQCVVCGRERTTQNRVSFGLTAGGIICQSCRPALTNVVNVSPAGIGLLIDLGESWKDLGTKIGTKIEPTELSTLKETKSDYTGLPSKDAVESATEIRKLINQYMTHLLGFEPRLHRFLKQLAV